MRAAIASENGNVAMHFGRCPHYTIVDIENEKVTRNEVVKNPGHTPGYLPKFLNEQGVECILSGGMGRKARELFDQYNIQALVGVSGSIDEVIAQLLRDEIAGGDNLCKPQHRHEGNGDCHH